MAIGAKVGSLKTRKDSLSSRNQCDHMARLFSQYLAIAKQ